MHQNLRDIALKLEQPLQLQQRGWKIPYQDSWMLEKFSIIYLLYVCIPQEELASMSCSLARKV